ncbi:MAG: type II secretion system protein [Phycisphaerae bacterium]|nr:type II secretion system protein [Tepidisphaeraceae bacterium]
MRTAWVAIRSAPRRRRRGRQGGFTLVEMLVTVAVLVIVLGLMVSLARYVRRRSAEDLTRRVLVNLHTATLQYTRQFGPINLPPVASDSDKPLDEATLRDRAEANNRLFVQIMRGHKDLSAKAFRDLPLPVYDDATVRDAWGAPILFMPGMHKQVGQSPDGWFFVSAGPDRLYLTRDDNQYSYEAFGVEVR